MRVVQGAGCTTADATLASSNLGELLGAAGVILFSEVIPTPMPWLRLDALFLK